jgi:hypothetical protein
MVQSRRLSFLLNLPTDTYFVLGETPEAKVILTYAGLVTVKERQNDFNVAKSCAH